MPTASAWSRVADRFPRPTRSTALMLLLAAILELLGRLIGSTGVTIAASAALGAVIADAALVPRVDGFSVRSIVPDRLTAGVPATFRLYVVAPPGRRGARRSVVAVVEHPGMPTLRIVTPSLDPGRQAIADVPMTPEARGYWDENFVITLEAYSPLGGYVRRRHITMRKPIWVHPAPAAAYRLPDVATGGGTGSSRSPRSGPGVDFFGIREWRAGDPSTAVHWRASAKRDQLVVMERERPAYTPLVVACGKSCNGACPGAVSRDDWEIGISRAAATAVDALRMGRVVALAGTPGALTPRSSREIYDWFARIDANQAMPNEHLNEALRSVGGAHTVLRVAGHRAKQNRLTAGDRNFGTRAVFSPLTSQTVVR